ncbi:hypothetical protein GCM10009674_28090 [Nesterenkonia xinjiangensis]
MTTKFPAFTDVGLAAVRAGTGRPLLLTNATVHTFDPLIGSMPDADVLIGADVIVGVGPGIVNAAEDDGAVVIDATGTMILPARLDLAAALGSRRRGCGAGTLSPGSAADLIVVDDALTPNPAAALDVAATCPERVRALLMGGVPVHWAGLAIGDERTKDRPLDRRVVDLQRVGAWVDTEGFLCQELTADGRYDETRGGRPHAFQGRYWVDGDRIDYLDDLGFWAFGRFDGDTLHHAGYTMHRKDDR